jgi:2-polyprenyl-3-methyl-5-hydroxy-6-metoxy-1,4-benzoquinol methylase
MLRCSLSKWEDTSNNWYKKTSKEIGHEIVPHRKQWEFFTLLRALEERGCIRPGMKGLVFGVGTEFTVSYLANRGCHILATDMSIENSKSVNWKDSNQLCLTKENLYYPNLINKDDFYRLVSFRNVDMNKIPKDLQDYDFCWSLCAFEHLGSAQHGYDFVHNSIQCLKPGGWAFHTTEFDCDPYGTIYETQDNVFYRELEIELLVKQIEDNGHYVEPRDYSLGDQLNDYPVQSNDYPHEHRSFKLFSGDSKLVTSMSLIIQRR